MEIKEKVNIRKDLDHAIDIAEKHFGRKGITQAFLRLNPDVFKSLQDIAKNDELFDALDLNGDKFISHEEVKALAEYAYRKDDLFIEDIKKYTLHLKNNKDERCNFPLIVVEDVPDVFKEDIVNAVESIPLKLKDFVLNSPKNNSYVVYLFNKLLTEVFPSDDPDLNRALQFASGCASEGGRSIEISTVLRDVNSKTSKTIYNEFPKHTLYHEFGHAFDFQLRENYLSPNLKYTYFSNSKRFKEAYDLDKEEFMRAFVNGKLNISQDDKSKLRKYMGELSVFNGEEETFAEVFASIMLPYNPDENIKSDPKYVPHIQSYFPRCTKVVLDAIRLFEPGFQSMLSSD